MKKYIFTESQIRTVIDHVTLNEDIWGGSYKVYSLHDLSELLSREHKIDPEIFRAALQQFYDEDGDYGVERAFKKSTGIDIESVGQRKYKIKF